MYTYKQEMIEIGENNGKIKNKDRSNYCHRMPMFPLLGANHLLPLLHMDKRFICLEETGDHISEVETGYMITPSFHVNKAFRYQVGKFMNTTFGALTQPFIKAKLF